MLRHQDSSQRNNRSRLSGFTLVEVLVALALLTTALVPAFVLASDAVNLSTRIRNSLISSNLAQEGVEVVRAIRDANWFAGQPFDTGLDSAACPAAGCRVQWNSDAVMPLSGNPSLKLDAVTGLYSYDATGTNTIFSRRIIIKDLTPVEIIVTSEVTWKERSTDRKVTLEYHLFDWIK